MIYSLIKSLRLLGVIPQFTFGISLGLGIGSSKSSSSSSSKTDLDQTKTGESQKTGSDTTVGTQTQEQDSTSSTATTGSKTATGVETSALSLLDQDSQNLIKNLMNDIAVGDGSNQELLKLLENRALGADAAFDNIVDPQIAEARRLQEQDLGTTVQALSRATGGGGKSNSIVAGFDLKGQQAIDSSIASLAASLGIEARQGATTEISNALQAGQGVNAGNAGAVAALADVLKGAEQTSTKQLQSNEQSTAVENVVQSLTAATSSAEVRDIIENLFSKDTLVGTEKTEASGTSREKSAGFSLAI